MSGSKLYGKSHWVPFISLTSELNEYHVGLYTSQYLDPGARAHLPRRSLNLPYLSLP